MDYYENTTRITHDGYAAIVRMKRRREQIVCRILGLLLAVPFVQRCVYYLIVRFTTDNHSVLGITDAVFTVLLLIAIYVWTLPGRRQKEYIRRTQNRIDLEAVHQYVFLSDYITMMTTSLLEKYQLPYEELTWVRGDSNWLVLYFERQNFTMLVDKKGFTKGNASDCLNFLRDKMDGKR